MEAQWWRSAIAWGDGIAGTQTMQTFAGDSRISTVSLQRERAPPASQPRQVPVAAEWSPTI